MPSWLLPFVGHLRLLRASPSLLNLKGHSACSLYAHIHPSARGHRRLAHSLSLSVSLSQGLCHQASGLWLHCVSAAQDPWLWHELPASPSHGTLLSGRVLPAPRHWAVTGETSPEKGRRKIPSARYAINLLPPTSLGISSLPLWLWDGMVVTEPTPLSLASLPCIWKISLFVSFFVLFISLALLPSHCPQILNFSQNPRQQDVSFYLLLQ